MSIFKKSDDALYKAGLADAERKIIPIWRQKLDDLENAKDEIISTKELEIMSLSIQLNNWKEVHEQDLKNNKLIRKEWSLIKIEWNKINRFKEEMRDRLTSKLNEDAEKVQDLFQLLGEYTFEQIENKS